MFHPFHFSLCPLLPGTSVISPFTESVEFLRLQDSSCKFGVLSGSICAAFLESHLLQHRSHPWGLGALHSEGHQETSLSSQLVCSGLSVVNFVPFRSFSNVPQSCTCIQGLYSCKVLSTKLCYLASTQKGNFSSVFEVFPYKKSYQFPWVICRSCSNTLVPVTRYGWWVDSHHLVDHALRI